VPPVKLRHLYFKHNAYYYVRRQNGRVVWTRLAADMPTAILKYNELIGRHDERHDVGAAIDKFLAVHGDRLAPYTLKCYGRYRDKLARVFAEFSDVSQITPVHIAQYLDASKRKVLANREISLLSAALQYVVRIGWLPANPCRDVRRNQERPRRRVYSAGEIDALRAAAGDRLRAMIDISLLTGLRQSDLLALRLADLGDEGISCEHHKTGARLVYEWTDELRDAIARAKRLRRRVGSLWLFSGPKGQRLSTQALRKDWAAVIDRVGLTNAHWHDLRATCLTRAKEQGGLDYAQALAGHARQATTEGYIAQRSVTKVRPIR
jgi:integrase